MRLRSSAIPGLALALLAIPLALMLLRRLQARRVFHHRMRRYDLLDRIYDFDAPHHVPENQRNVAHTSSVVGW